MLHYWSRMTSPQLEELAQPESVVLLPVGATEQHGPHLPTGVDYFVVDDIVKRLPDRLRKDVDVVVLPTLPYGKSTEHEGFAGTVSLSLETLVAVMNDLARAVSESGFTKFLVLNGHGGNYAVLVALMRDLHVRYELQSVACDWTLLIPPPQNEQERIERDHGVHAGKLETAMMLHTRSEWVVEEEIRNFRNRVKEQESDNEYFRHAGPAYVGWVTETLNPAGAVGDAEAATAKLGKTLYDQASDALATLIHEMVDGPSPPDDQ